jgi:hypothetical protein
MPDARQLQKSRLSEKPSEAADVLIQPADFMNGRKKARAQNSHKRPFLKHFL